MAGVNDPAFRLMCRRLGAELSYTEMISSKGLAYHNKQTQDMLAAFDGDTPFAVQLFGNEPDVMATQARLLEQRLGSDLALIDLNMGCPARKVVAGGNGAALMRNPELAYKIIVAVVKSVHVPVTVKIRKSSDSGAHRTLDFARMAEDAGVAALCVHGRSAEQHYQEQADKQLVCELAQALVVPVIATGDVMDAYDVRDYLRCGVSGVMIARGALGNPWIFRQAQALLAGDEQAATVTPSVAEIVRLASDHIRMLYAHDPKKLVWMRRHLAWYLKGMPHAATLRRRLQSCVSLDDYLSLLAGLDKGEL